MSFLNSILHLFSVPFLSSTQAESAPSPGAIGGDQAGEGFLRPDDVGVVGLDMIAPIVPGIGGGVNGRWLDPDVFLGEADVCDKIGGWE